MLKGLKGLIGPLVLVVTTIFHNVAPETVQAAGEAAVMIAEGVGVLLSVVGIGRKVQAERSK